jgi:predicted XRE-type DNA-binding protein
LDVKEESMSKHWSTTPAGSLVARCTIFIYQKIQKGEEEGGWKSYFDEHNSKFINSDTEEHNHELHDLFRTFESKLEEALEEFAEKEALSTYEVARIIGDVDDTNPRASKFVKKLLSSFSYEKFCSLMRDRAVIMSCDDTQYCSSSGGLQVLGASSVWTGK